MDHVLWAELKGGLFNLSFLARRTHGAPLSLVHVSGSVGIDDVERAASLSTSIMDKAYAGMQHCASGCRFSIQLCPNVQVSIGIES